ncbi:MAG: hypothetical protein MR522_02905 [Trueperella sp.]|uniref:hypothetical protein n=1 Tax=Trueperella sp. TaxID=2699835 RepID=UPI0025E861C3|nr:hypothetical protein [Trueperella sp.]MCI7305205.1 hypothetical protein [Trueperella sp.]MDY5403838.1 hypothetical protein [Trueperella sp.]
MVEAVGIRGLTTLYAPFYDALSKGSRIFIDSDRMAVDPAMEIDDFLQFSLLDGVEISDELLDITEASVRGGWDPELTERTLGWIAKHRQRNQAA